MKNLITLIIMMFTLGTFAQETFLTAEDLQREKDLRQARVNELKDHPLQSLQKPVAFGYKIQSDQAMPMENTFKNDNGVWLNWDNGTNNNAIGSGEAINWDIAARFEPSDLEGLNGNFITLIRFFLFEDASVTLKVWQGAFAQNEVYSQEVSDYNLQDWTFIELNTPVLIDTSQELWIGYTITAPGGTFPAGVDSGPAVQGKGDWVRFNDGTGNPQEWTTLTELIGPLFNWNIQAFAETLADPGAPDSPQNLLVSAGAGGELTANLEWTNPALTFDGQDLSSLDNIFVFRGQTLIHTISNPQTGAAESFTDNVVPDDGTYTYRVVGENQLGQGIPASSTVFVGEDVPAAPANLLIAEQDGNGFLSWDAPQTGINNGYVDPALITYSIIRMPDNVTVAANISATTFLDMGIPSPGNYFYRVTASNNQGTGGTSTSNVITLGTDGKLFFEAFDYPAGTIPAGWQQTGNAPHHWAVGQSNTAGGSAPELVLSWLSSATGISRMVSPVINADEFSGLRISFKQYLDNFYSFDNEQVALEFTTDGGNTWEVIWEQDLLSQDIPQGDYDFSFALPQDASSFQIAFRFQGNSFNIDYWYIDDVSIEPLLGNNLAATSVIGNATPSVGLESVYTVTVANVGEFTQNDYTVKLMGEGDVELASVPGQPIQSGQNLQFELPWTPAQQGNTFVYGLVDFDADEFPGNNTTAHLQIQVQPEGTFIVQVGEGNQQSINIPFNFFWKQSLSQTIYFPEELVIGGGVITSLRYNSIFAQDIGDKDVKVWIGETDLNDLANEWADFANLALVYDGTVDFSQGENEILIPLDNPYVYNGGNLVVYTNRVWENVFYGSGNTFLVSQDPASVIRSRFFNTDQQEDPENPGFANVTTQYPNTTFFFSLEGLGGIEGNVTENNEPLEGVRVKVTGKPAVVQTDENGFYSLPNLLAGEYDLEFSKFGYFSQTIDQVVIAEDEITTVDAELEAIPQYAISGAVEGNDGLVPGEINISLTGYDNYNITADTDGVFILGNVYEGEYVLSISSPGYDTFRDDNFVVDANLDMGVIILTETIIPPGGLVIDYDNFGAGNALLTWNQAGGQTEFRYDNGTVSNALGTQSSTFNTVLGSAHTNSAELFEMSWLIPVDNEFTENDIIRVWVFGLDENGVPDRDQLLYSSDDITVNFGDWTTYQFTQPVNAPNGFFMGISSEGFLGIATDDGLDPEWPFNNNTHFVNFDVTFDDFHAIEMFGFEWNFFIRANGFDFGTLKNIQLPENIIAGGIPDGNLQQFNVSPFSPASASGNVAGVKSQKAFSGYNIYLNDLETPFAFTEEQEFLFTELAEGEQLAGVQSVFTTGVSDVVTIEFDVVYPVEVTINATTNSGASAEGAFINVTNQENSNYNYSAMVDETGVVFFASVRKGTYTLLATLENHQSQQIIDLEIQEDFEIDIEFTEVIDPPVNLMVLTEGLEAGQALFSWNNPTQGWTESFEGGELPENWSQIITNTGSQSGFDATWSIVETVPFSNSIVPQDGNYQAFVMWSFMQQDEWLISPEFTAPAGDLVFWYHGTNGSTFGDNYYVKITTDGGNNWSVLWNASNLPSGVNHYQTPVTIDLSFYAGQQVKLAWHASDGPSGVGLWSSWAIDNITVGGQPLDLKDFAMESGSDANMQNSANKNILGYNVYLDGMLVAENVQDNQYLFNNVADGPRVAGVEAVYATGTSDIAVKEFILRETWLLSLVSNPAGSGSLSGAAWYAEGAEVLVNAIANEGFLFINWSNTAGQVVSEEPAFFYTMPANDVVLIANFGEAEFFNVTFNIDMTSAPGFNPFDSDVAVTGSMHNWTVLGNNHRNQVMAGDHSTMIYTKTLTLAPGVYEYKYFLNEGEHDHEWEETENREIIVSSNMEVHDVWGMITNVNDISGLDQVRVFPNPFNNHIEIEGADMADRIIITNILGKIVMNEPLTGNRIDTSALPTGVYVLHLEGDGAVKSVKKMIKQ
jgi:hypothetical protein